MAQDTADDELQIEFISSQEREYFARANLGEEAIQFLNSNIGKYLHGCAKQEVEILRDAMEECNPDSIFGRRKLRRLQAKAQPARYFMQWCVEVINDGEFAFQQLKNDE